MPKLTLAAVMTAIKETKLATLPRDQAEAILVTEARRLIASALKVLNHAEVAEVLHTSRQTIYNWQNGRAIDPVYAYWTIVTLGPIFPKRKRATKAKVKKETKS